MNLLEIDRKVINSKAKFGNILEQEWFKGIQNLFQLIGGKAGESGFDSGFLCQILRTLILEAGTAVERRLPYAELFDKWCAKEISDAELRAQEAEAIHGPCQKPYYPRTCSPHPIIRPAVTAKNIISDYLQRLEEESPK